MTKGHGLGCIAWSSDDTDAQRRARALVLGIGLATLLVLAGCTGAGPATTESAAPTETPTTDEPTPTDEPMPTETPTPTDEPTTPDEPPVTLALERRAGEWGEGRTITGNVSQYTVEMPQFGSQTRTVWVYVPPGYGDTDRQYPVVYMQDGQNLFDDVAASEEWGVDETMERLATEADLQAIVVGVENAGAERDEEYLPWSDGELGGNGSRYAAFLAETLKPTVDATFRTDPDRTAVMGSSFGGVISVYTAFAYPEQFQYVGGMSTAHVWPGFDVSVTELYGFLNESGPGPERVYLDWGTDEGTDPARFNAANERLVETVDGLGYDRGSDLLVVPETGAGHRERFWKARFPRAVQWLLTGEDPDT